MGLLICLESFLWLCSLVSNIYENKFYILNDSINQLLFNGSIIHKLIEKQEQIINFTKPIKIFEGNNKYWKVCPFKLTQQTSSLLSHYSSYIFFFLLLEKNKEANTTIRQESIYSPLGKSYWIIFFFLQQFFYSENNK